MKRLLKTSALFFILITLLCLTSTNTRAEQIGDTVTVKMFVTGQSDMVSMAAKLEYDSNVFDVMEANVLYGTASCNTSNAGEIMWASIFDANTGMDFSEKTEVMTATFIVKQECSSIDNLITYTVIEAYDSNLQNVSPGCVTAEFDGVSSGEPQVFSEEESKSTEVSSKFVVSKYEPAESRASSEKNHSKESEVKSKREESSKKETDTVSEKENSSENIIPEADSAGSLLSDNYASEEKATLDTPTDKNSNPSTQKKNDANNTYLLALAAGFAVIVVLAAALIVIKKHTVNKNASHMR